MKAISLDQLNEGDSFTDGVYLDEDSLFVGSGVAIKKADLERLKNWGITQVLTNGELIQKPKGVRPQESLSLTFNLANNPKLMEKYTEMRDSLAELFDSVEAGISVGQEKVNPIVDTILSLLTKSRDEVIQFIIFGQQGESDFLENGINAAFIAALIAEQMSMPRHRLLKLVTGVLLRDIGMIMVHRDVRGKKEKLNEDELKQIRLHPLHSYKIITTKLKLADETAIVALQHQERWDGAGYPRGLKGPEIDTLARIAAVADSFEALISERPYRNSMIGYQAVKQLLSDNSRHFDPDVLKVFIQTLGIYPMGSLVLLSDGAIGIVIKSLPNAPLRPNIKLLIKANGDVAVGNQAQEIKLSSVKELFIVRAIDPKEIEKITG